jgi:hypothetical protein
VVCDSDLTDVLREIRRDVAENLEETRFTRIAEGDKAVAELGETHLMMRIANREKAVEVHGCLPRRVFGMRLGAQSPLEPFRSQCLRSADVEALGRKAANTHNDPGKPTFSSMAL